MANNRYDGGQLVIRPDGTYQFSLAHTLGNPYIKDDTLQTVSTAEGPYVAAGSVYALDPGTARMAFAVNMGDSLRVYRNDVSQSVNS